MVPKKILTFKLSRYPNLIMKSEICECIKKENEKITKELEESKALKKKITQQNGLIMKELN